MKSITPNYPSMTRYLTSFALILLSISLYAQENNPLIVSGPLIDQAGNLYDSGQYKKAIGLYERIDRNDTNYVRALYGISACLYEDSQFSASLEYARKGLTLNSDPERKPDLYNRIANTLNEANASEQAIQVYDSAINKYPAYSILYLNKGSALIKLGRYADAEAVFRQALLIDPYSYSSHYKLGYCALSQGKLVPAFLSYMGYLLLDPEGKFKSNCIRGLDAIAKNMDTIQTILNTRKIDPDENYALLEQILQSKIALDRNYKPMIQLDDPISRQIQVVFEKMQYQESDSDFWMQYYIPYFKSVFANRQFEYLINRMFDGVDIPVIQEFNKKNKKAIQALLESAATYFNHIRSTRELNYAKRDTASASWFFSKGELSSHGTYLVKEDRLLGDWQFFYNPGNLRYAGSYNSAGKKEGWFHSYFFDGRLKGKEFYSNGQQEGEETSWFSTGTMAAHSWYTKGLLEGESVSYFWVGTPHTITHYHEGKEDGIKLTFQNNGDTALLEHYTAGTLNGEVRSWNGNRSIAVIASYKDGQLDGDYKKCYPNGRLQVEGTYKAGKQDGEWKAWYNDGQLKSIDHFVNDKSEGEYREYYDNGVLHFSCAQKNGKINGEVKYFDDDGKVFHIDNYSNGRLQKATYFDKTGIQIGKSESAGPGIDLLDFLPDGSRRVQYSYDEKGNINGTETFYYPSGKVFETDVYQAGSEQGPSIAYYTNGNKKVETPYVDGKQDGYHRSWYHHGQVQEEGWYKDGNAQGYWLYHNELGALTDSVYYSDGVVEGYRSEFTPNGRKEFERKFHGGWLEEYVQYDTTGNELRRFHLPEGTGQVRFVYPNGKPYISVDYRRSQKVGASTEWYVTGEPMELAWYNNGLQDSTYKTFYRSGAVNAEGQFRNGEKTGVWKLHYTDGSAAVEQYVHGEQNGLERRYYPGGRKEYELIYKDGKEEGLGKWFDPDGTLLYQMRYKNDVPVGYSYLDSKDSLVPEIPIRRQAGKVKAFFPNGKVSAEFEYEDGVFSGDKRLYYTNGQLKEVLHWNDGVLEGAYLGYYPNGQVKVAGTYLHGNLHGPYKYYNEKGVVREEWNYYCGSPHGTIRLFDDSGRLVETDYYYYGTLLSVKK